MPSSTVRGLLSTLAGPVCTLEGERQMRGLLLISLSGLSLMCAGCATTPSPAPAAAGQAGAAAGAAAAPASPTLLDFLGVGQMIQASHNDRVARRKAAWAAFFPECEPKPELLTDYGSSDFGGGCQPRRQGGCGTQGRRGQGGPKNERRFATSPASAASSVTPITASKKSLLAALDDCTEAVRYEAVVGLA